MRLVISTLSSHTSTRTHHEAQLASLPSAHHELCMRPSLSWYNRKNSYQWVVCASSSRSHVFQHCAVELRPSISIIIRPSSVPVRVDKVRTFSQITKCIERRINTPKRSNSHPTNTGCIRSYQRKETDQNNFVVGEISTASSWIITISRWRHDPINVLLLSVIEKKSRHNNDITANIFSVFLITWRTSQPCCQHEA